MADDAVKLPPGYTLDEPVKLPPGYSLDAAPASANVLDDPRNQFVGTSNGIPVYRTPPGSFLHETVENPIRQLGAGGELLGAFGTHLTGNIANLLDSAAGYIADKTGLEKGGVFGHLRDWARAQEALQLQTAARLSAGRQDLASQIYRSIIPAVGEIPAYMLAAAPAGPIAGIAALSGLQASDRGPVEALKAAAEGAATGGAMTVMGPASRLIRGPAMAAMTYAQSKAGGADNTTALANALTMGGMSAYPPGGMTAADIARMNFNQAKQFGAKALTLPWFQSTLNPVEAKAIAGMEAAGVPMTAGTLTGNRFLRTAEQVTAASPLGAVPAARFQQSTNEAVNAMAEDIMRQAYPEPQSPESAGAATRAGLDQTIAGFQGQANEAYKAAWQGRGQPQYTQEVPIRTHSDGSVELAPVNMPVDIRDVKQLAEPIYDELDSKLSQSEKSQNAAFNAMAKLLQEDNYIPAWRAEPMLSALKSMARVNNKTGVRDYGQGAAAGLVGSLQDAIDNAVAATGNDALAGLRAGRQAHAQMMDVVDTAETLPSEPVQAFGRLVWPHDSGIDFLRRVAEQAPDALPKLGQALIRKLMDYATREGDIGKTQGTLKTWRDLGPKTKELLFPDAALRDQLDSLFKGMDMIVRRVNPSETAITKETFTYNPLKWLGGLVGGNILFTPQGIASLTQALRAQAGPARISVKPGMTPSQAQAQFEQQRSGGEPPEGSPPPSATINPEAGESAYQEQQGRIGPGEPETPPAPAGAAAEAPKAAKITAATAWAREQIAAGNKVWIPQLSRKFGLDYGEANKLLEDLAPKTPPAAGAGAAPSS